MFIFHKETTLEDLGNGVTRRILAHDGKLMAVEVNFEQGAVGPMHSHPHEQLTYVLSGEFEFTIGEEKHVVSAGDTLTSNPILCTAASVYSREHYSIPSPRYAKTSCRRNLSILEPCYTKMPGIAYAYPACTRRHPTLRLTTYTPISLNFSPAISLRSICSSVTFLVSGISQKVIPINTTFSAV